MEPEVVEVCVEMEGRWKTPEKRRKPKTANIPKTLFGALNVCEPKRTDFDNGGADEGVSGEVLVGKGAGLEVAIKRHVKNVVDLGRATGCGAVVI